MELERWRLFKMEMMMMMIKLRVNGRESDSELSIMEPKRKLLLFLFLISYIHCLSKKKSLTFIMQLANLGYKLLLLPTFYRPLILFLFFLNQAAFGLVFTYLSQSSFAPYITLAANYKIFFQSLKFNLENSGRP